MFDFANEYRAGVVASEVWAARNKDYTKKKHRYTTEDGLGFCRSNNAGEYVDCHCFVFTPYSFLEVVPGLVGMGLFDYEVVGFFETPENEYEFFVSLKKSNKSPQERLKTIPKLASPPTVEKQQDQITRLEAQLHDILTSTSWRITKPVRSLKSLLNKRPEN